MTIMGVSNGIRDEAQFSDAQQKLFFECTYFANDVDFGDLSSLTQTVEAFRLPPKSTTDMLVDAYFSTIHPFYPILSESHFMTQYNVYLQRNALPEGGHVWLAILNIVLAIGDLYTQCVQTSQESPGDDDTIFWLRSHALSPDTSHILGVPTLPQIQLLSVTGLYFLSRYQINR
jgi:hypothetical protein